MRIRNKLPKHAVFDFVGIFGEKHYHTPNKTYEVHEENGNQVIYSFWKNNKSEERELYKG